jgi:hypothetical protein
MRVILFVFNCVSITIQIYGAQPIPGKLFWLNFYVRAKKSAQPSGGHQKQKICVKTGLKKEGRQYLPECHRHRRNLSWTTEQDRSIRKQRETQLRSYSPAHAGMNLPAAVVLSATPLFSALHIW